MANINNTSLVNISTLARLADTTIEATVVEFGGMAVNPDIAAALRTQAAERKAEVVRAAANEILNLSQNADSFLALQAAAKQALLEQVAGIDKACAGVNRARQYGMTTNNFLPLASTIGMSIPASTKTELKAVPKDWALTAVAAA